MRAFIAPFRKTAPSMFMEVFVRNVLRSLALCVGAVFAVPCLAWGPDGHRTIGVIAERLIAGSHAAKEVRAILGDLSLADATVWADCAKGVSPKTFRYGGVGRFRECRIFETPEGEAAMEDFVRRNATNCVIRPGEEVCHAQYHYADIDVAHGRYRAGWIGSRNDDVVAATVAAIHVLRGEAAPSPFSIKDKREALLLLAHYVGDIHQPLHVGAIYLDARGNRVNPDAGSFDPATSTRGGNSLRVARRNGSPGKNLHSTWDAVPASMKPTRVDTSWVASARRVARSSGSVLDWPQAWASESVMSAKNAFVGVRFKPLGQDEWIATLPAGYASRMTAVKKHQLTYAGARLAQVLQSIWR